MQLYKKIITGLLLLIFAYAVGSAWKKVFDHFIKKIVGKEVYQTIYFQLGFAIILTIIMFFILKSMKKIKLAHFGIKEI